MSETRFECKSVDGLTLRAWIRLPETTPKALICLVHGLGEHSGRYTHVTDRLIQTGYAVTRWDLRGHGRSDGLRGDAPRYSILLEDLHIVRRAAVEQVPNVPLFLYGHSMGGTIAMQYALNQPEDLAGLIVSSPMLRTTAPPPAWKSLLLTALHRVCPRLGLSSGVQAAGLSRRSDIVVQYQNDPLCHTRITLKMAHGLIDSGQQILQRASELKIPMLLLHGSEDRITDPQASSEFAQEATPLCTLNQWEGCLHELHHEPEAEDILDQIEAWLEAHIAPPSTHSEGLQSD